MIKKLTRVSAVAAALACRVNDPAPATAATDLSVVSFVPTVQIMIELVVTRLSVTTREVAAAAKLTVPAFLLIV
jgi:2-keto-4-pentenoate hydratase